MSVLRSLMILLFCFLISPLVHRASAKDAWISLHTQNYHLVGNVKESELRGIAVQLERFRHIFTKQFENADLNSPVATTVVVFKNSGSFGPYKRVPGVDSAAYFQPGEDMNYIALALGNWVSDPFEMIFHESVHLLVNNKVRSLPSWFNEGLAEYFSTLDFLPEKKRGDRRVAFGKPILHHLIKLRENKLLPLETVFSVDPSSPFYNEGDKKSLFYAQSWALIHYLTHGRSGERASQLARFLELLTARHPVADSFKQAFGKDYVSLERELKDYVRQDRYPAKVVSFEEPAGTNSDSKIEQLSEAQAFTYLGDLLLHTNHFDAAEKHLKKALTFAPELSTANASLGVLRLRQGDVAAAKGLLQKAIASDQNNYLAQYYYADALSREEMGLDRQVWSYPQESAARIRVALNKAIEVAPGFPEPYRLLAFVNLATDTQLTESVALLEKAIALSPGRLDFSYVLAQVQLRRKDYKAARLTLEQVIAGNPSPQMRGRAEVMLNTVVMEEQNQPKQ